jgi:hypothetical protein
MVRAQDHHAPGPLGVQEGCVAVPVTRGASRIVQVRNHDPGQGGGVVRECGSVGVWECGSGVCERNPHTPILPYAHTGRPGHGFRQDPVEEGGELRGGGAETVRAPQWPHRIAAVLPDQTFVIDFEAGALQVTGGLELVQEPVQVRGEQDLSGPARVLALDLQPSPGAVQQREEAEVSRLDNQETGGELGGVAQDDPAVLRVRDRFYGAQAGVFALVHRRLSLAEGAQRAQEICS